MKRGVAHSIQGWYLDRRERGFKVVGSMHRLMRAILALFIILGTSISSGCLYEEPTPDPSTNPPGCYEGQPDEEPLECTIDTTVQNNSTSGDLNQTTPDGGGEVDPPSDGGVNETTSENNTDEQDQLPEYGPWEGFLAPLTTAEARDLGGEWHEWSLQDHFNMSWNGTRAGMQNGSDEPWVLIEFLSTDCVHCWNAADDMSDLHFQYGARVVFLSFAVNFSSNDYFNASRDEVAAFQDKSQHSGCRGNQHDCSTRPGDAHDWLYVDDRNQSAMYDFASQGTPMFVIIQPNGLIVWHQYQHDGDEGEDSENIVEALARFFPSG